MAIDNTTRADGSTASSAARPFEPDRDRVSASGPTPYRDGDEPYVDDATRAKRRAARTDASHHSIGSLFSALWRQTTRLAQEEAALAKADVSEKVTQVMAGSGAIAAGGALAFAGFLALMLAAINALLPLLPPDIAPWLSPLIIGVAVLVVGYIVFAGGRRELKAKRLAPTRAVESLRQDSRMVKEHLQ